MTEDDWKDITVMNGFSKGIRNSIIGLDENGEIMLEEKKQTLLEKVKDKLEDFVWPVVRLYRRIKRVVQYAKIGYDTEDFDSAYAMREFCDKLDTLANHIEKHKLHTDYEENVKDIRAATERLRRVIDDDYYFELVKPLDEKYGERKYSWEDAVEEEAKQRGLKQRFSYREKQTPENDEEIEALERKAMDDSIKLRQKEWDEALDILRKHFFEWWD